MGKSKRDANRAELAVYLYVYDIYCLSKYGKAGHFEYGIVGTCNFYRISRISSR